MYMSAWVCKPITGIYTAAPVYAALTAAHCT
jgi:hypothetical protein